MVTMFVPATKWSMLPYDVQLIVVLQLPISYRVALERVDSTFGEISEELFNQQEKIPIEKEFDDRWYPYSKLVLRCPNLKEFDFHRYIKHRFPGVYSEQIKAEMFNKGGNMFKLLPNIKSFKNIRNNAVQVVSRYLIDRYSTNYENEPFHYLDTPHSNLEVVHQLYGLVEYKLKHISWPLIYGSELDQWELLIDKRLSVKHIESIDDGRCVSCLSDFNYILSKLLKKPSLKLRKIRANINQENFDILSRSPSLISFTPSLCEPTNISRLVNFVHVKHLDLLTGHFFKSLTDFGTKNYEINDVMIDYFERNGRNLKTLKINLSKREHLLNVIADCCVNLRFLKFRVDLDIRPKTWIINHISRMRCLKHLNIRSIFTRHEHDLILELVPTMIRFDCVVCESYEAYRDSKKDELVMLKIFNEKLNQPIYLL